MPSANVDPPAANTPSRQEWDDLFAGLQREPRKRPWIWLVYLLLFAAAIPWYWPASFSGPLVAGLPLWVGVTLGFIFLLAVWTAFVITRYWDDEEGARSPE